MKKNVVELEKQLSDPKVAIDSYDFMEKRTDLARALYTLSLTGSMPDQKVTNKIVGSLEKDMNYLSAETIAYVTIALKNIKNVDQANLFYKRLLALGNTAEGTMDWDQTVSMSKKILWKNPARFHAFSYRFTGVETTALALRAVLAMEASGERAESIKRWLLLQRGKDGWDNTKTTAEVFLVLLKDDLLNGATRETNFSLDALKNESVIAQLKFDQKSRYAGETKIPLSRAMKDGTVSLKKEGPGKLYYTLLQTYFRKLSPGENIEAEALPKGLKISRKFFHLQTVKEASTGTVHYRTVPITGGQIKSGETVLMKVYVDSPVRVPYIIVESPLPSGAEVVQDHKSEEMEGASGGSVIEGDWGAPWWTHQDVLDDRIVFFGTEMPAGKSEFHTLLRMELPGDVQLNPVSFEGMYTKNVRGFSMLDALKISD
ncbi:MAG: hypothetical protein C0507_25310 [Cyanobacteria bacterium PR.3.49]|nr:hypothetical protein [Cyanobacteria bacterium PR.3.49]